MSLGPASLEGRRTLVTGAAGGIGAAIVETFAHAGARIVGVDVGDRRAPSPAISIGCDLSDGAAVKGLDDAIDTHLGGLDVLVHSAGITRDAVLWKMEESDWEAVMRVNLDSAFHLLRLAVPWMREAGGGSIVLLTSINGERGKFGQANYAASKAGLIGLARSAARELGRFSIRVNCIAPGLILTPMTQGLPANVLEAAVSETALGRAGRPVDVAHAALFLACAMSTHVTGQVLRVDGGQLMA